MRSAKIRLAALPLAAVSAIALWQASLLETWTVFGPGPGLFPLIVSIVCAVSCLLMLAFPGRQVADQGREDGTEAAIQPAEVRTFRTCAAALVLMALCTALDVGFLMTSMLLTLAITWYGERRKFAHALLFGALAGLVGTVLFGGVLGVEIPEGLLEQSLLRALR